MASLADYSNVDSTAVTLLRKKGYQVWYDEPSSLFFAEKAGWDFAADSPCGLLGVIAIYEEIAPEKFTEYWWKLSSDRLSATLPRCPKPYVSVQDRTSS